jgi:hypothetical protein
MTDCTMCGAPIAYEDDTWRHVDALIDIGHDARTWPPPGYIDLGFLEPGDSIEVPPGFTGAVWME